MIYHISKRDRTLKGTIHLTASKSESNRVLIIRALSKQLFEIHNLAGAQDTQTLLDILELRVKNRDSGQEKIEIDVGPAGTAMRFLTALFSITDGERILTGSDRMKQRPIGILVDALKKLGASIEYVEKEGFPPLLIKGRKLEGGAIEIDGSVSSQFISALLLIAPVLKNGIELYLKGAVSSKPYILMTLGVMERFGIKYTWNENMIRVEQQEYKWSREEPYNAEADWSAASYYYAMAALADEVDLVIKGFQKNSLQGDSVLAAMYETFGVRTECLETGVRLTKGEKQMNPFNYNFESCPDIAQTVAVTVAALGIPSLLEGLQSLKIKETDRIKALQNELTKLSVMVEATPASLFINAPSGISFPASVISTYDDHRMAMSFAALAMRGEIRIADPHVVSKSYPAFWNDLKQLGFVVNEE